MQLRQEGGSGLPDSKVSQHPAGQHQARGPAAIPLDDLSAGQRDDRVPGETGGGGEEAVFAGVEGGGLDRRGQGDLVAAGRQRLGEKKGDGLLGGGGVGEAGDDVDVGAGIVDGGGGRDGDDRPTKGPEPGDDVIGGVLGGAPGRGGRPGG